MPCRAAKPSTRLHQSTIELVGYKLSHSVPPAASVVCLDPRVTCMENSIQEKKLSQLADKMFGVTADEAVDAKAASYISSVRERFKHESTTQERM